MKNNFIIIVFVILLLTIIPSFAFSQNQTLAYNFTYTYSIYEIVTTEKNYITINESINTIYNITSDKINYKLYAVNYSREIDNATIKFKVDKIWIALNKVNVSQISLYSYSDGWSKLPTHIIEEDFLFFYFESEARTFSLLAINAQKNIQELKNESVGNESIQERVVITISPDKGEAKSGESEKKENVVKFTPDFQTILTTIFTFVVLVFVYLLIKKSVDTKVSKVSVEEIETLKKYIVAELEKGKTKEQIRKYLLEHAWEEKFIDKILFEYENK